MITSINEFEILIKENIKKMEVT